MAGKNEIKKIAVIRLDRVGDLILTTPAITLIRELFPASYISAIVSSYAKDVLDGNRSVDEIIAADNGKKGLSLISAFQLGYKLRDKKFDLVFVFSPHTDAYILAFGLGASYRIGYTYASRRFTRIIGGFLLTHWVTEPPDQNVVEKNEKSVPHEIEQNTALVTSFFDREKLNFSGQIDKFKLEQRIHAPIPDLTLSVKEEEWRFAGEFLKKQGVDSNSRLLGLHLSVRWQNSVSETDMGSIVDRLTALWNGPLLITAGPGEREWLDKLRPRFSSSNIILAEGLPLKQWAALLGSCKMVISPDTGSLHVASAMKVPVVAVLEERFFFYHSQRWRPWNVPYVIIKKPHTFLLDPFMDSLKTAICKLSENLHGRTICQTN